MSKFVPHTNGMLYIVRTHGFKDHDIIMEWCENRLVYHYSNTYFGSSEITYWYFQDRKEAIKFALTWT